MIKDRSIFYSIWGALACLCILACKERKSVKSTQVINEVVQKVQRVDPSGTTIETRFLPPEDFSRVRVDSSSFGAFLRTFPLLGIDQKVHLFDGTLKGNQTAHASILDIDVGSRDLQQCADAVMRLRADYLLENKRYSEIAFDFTNGWKFEYSKWREGNNLVVKGNSTYWQSGNQKKESYSEYRKYLDWVFMYAGTLSLSKELSVKPIDQIEIGDVFIKGGSPGHAVIVVDVAEHATTGEKAFMLAQSYMPAQQIHILKNPENSENSPWYLLSEVNPQLATPEWTFRKEDLMHF